MWLHEFQKLWILQLMYSELSASMSIPIDVTLIRFYIQGLASIKVRTDRFITVLMYLGCFHRSIGFSSILCAQYHQPSSLTSSVNIIFLSVQMCRWIHDDGLFKCVHESLFQSIYCSIRLFGIEPIHGSSLQQRHEWVAIIGIKM
jgi:hypothetical protein